ncbi:MAG: hypothetical protein NVS4B2_31160 [Chloroflexota bacterium]
MTQDPYLFGGSEKQVRRTQQRFVDVLSGASPVLDIGCGRGIFMRLLRSAGTRVVGIDPHAPAVERCRADGLDVHCADALSYLPDHTDHFGGIFCSHVIEHLDFEDGQRLVDGCATAMKRGGRLVIVTPNPSDLGVIGNTFWLDPSHVRPYPVLLLRSMVTQAGLRVVRSGVFHGGVPKREIGTYLLKRAMLGSFYGKPNAYVLASKDI